jgi:hypothetical protein
MGEPGAPGDWTPAMLDALEDEALRRLIAFAAGLLAHRQGGPHVCAVCGRITRALEPRSVLQ